MVLDNFLSKLGAVISSTLRHIVTPPAPLFPAYHTPRVTFHFFLISNEVLYIPHTGPQFKAQTDIFFNVPNHPG